MKTVNIVFSEVKVGEKFSDKHGVYLKVNDTQASLVGYFIKFTFRPDEVMTAFPAVARVGVSLTKVDVIHA